MLLRLHAPNDTASLPGWRLYLDPITGDGGATTLQRVPQAAISSSGADSSSGPEGATLVCDIVIGHAQRSFTTRDCAALGVALAAACGVDEAQVAISRRDGEAADNAGAKDGGERKHSGVQASDKVTLRARISSVCRRFSSSHSATRADSAKFENHR